MVAIRLNHMGWIMTDSAENRYDVVPYADGPYAFSHPRHMETMATLFGMEPVPIDDCRVLELGCASGGNLIPQAVHLPEASFLGIDLSQREIDEGQKTIRALGLENIELRHANILDVDDDWGKFDYIICHGILSWVPEDVQHKILRISRRNLTPNGVAYVSYNTYPGWHLVRVVRDLMRYHSRQFGDPNRQISEALAALKFMADLSNSSKAAGKLFAEESELLDKFGGNGSYLFHEHLEPHNQPFYFYEFIERAEAAGLQYLSSVDLAPMLLQNYHKTAAEILKSLPLIQQEQYTDFLQGRRFRRTLLCHREVRLNRALCGSQMMNFHVGLQKLQAGTEVDLRNDQPLELKSEEGSLKTNNRLNKAAIMYLMEIHPNYVHFDDLYQTAVSRLKLVSAEDDRSPETSRRALADCIMTGFCTNMFRICLHPPRCSKQPGERPLAGPLPRMEATKGEAVTNQFHARVKLDDLCRYLTPRLDGRHDRMALIHSVEQALASGALKVAMDGKTVEKLDPAVLSNTIDEALSRISNAALLIP